MVLLLGQGTSIALATSKGTPIENEQNSVIPEYDQHMDQVIAAKHLSAHARSPMTGRYNCHGLVFASRRTRIFSVSDINKILHDDGYTDVALTQVLAGDCILYLEAGDIIHSGLVVEPPNKENMFNPLVVSKWGSGREYVHRGNDCPYAFNVKYIRVNKYD